MGPLKKMKKKNNCSGRTAIFRELVMTIFGISKNKDVIKNKAIIELKGKTPKLILPPVMDFIPAKSGTRYTPQLATSVAPLVYVVVGRLTFFFAVLYYQVLHLQSLVFY